MNVDMQKIGIIDDDPSIVDVFTQMLTIFGYVPSPYTDPSVALKSLPNEKPLPNLILLDLMMEPITGLQFLDEKLKNPVLKGIPVIIVSAWDLSEEDRLKYATAISDVIRKPVHPKDLVNKIQTVIDKSP